MLLRKKKEKRMEKNEHSLRYLWRNIKHTNIQIMGVQEGEKRKRQREQQTGRSSPTDLASMMSAPSTPWATAVLEYMPVSGAQTGSVCIPARSRMVACSLSLKLFLKMTPRTPLSPLLQTPVTQNCSRP